MNNKKRQELRRQRRNLIKKIERNHRTCDILADSLESKMSRKEKIKLLTRFGIAINEKSSAEKVDQKIRSSIESLSK